MKTVLLIPLGGKKEKRKILIFHIVRATRQSLRTQQCTSEPGLKIRQLKDPATFYANFFLKEGILLLVTSLVIFNNFHNLIVGLVCHLDNMA